VPSPSFDHDLRLLERVEDFAVEQRKLYAETRVEAVVQAIKIGLITL
jgi:hypothetical protein